MTKAKAAKAIHPMIIEPRPLERVLGLSPPARVPDPRPTAATRERNSGPHGLSTRSRCRITLAAKEWSGRGSLKKRSFIRIVIGIRLRGWGGTSFANIVFGCLSQ